MVSITKDLGAITKGQYMSWFITTQAANRINVKLYDSVKTYVNSNKASIHIDPPLAQGAAFVEGDHLKLEISSSGWNDLKTCHNMSDILTDACTPVGKSFSLAGEDYTDNDYNDVYVSISAWDKAY